MINRAIYDQLIKKEIVLVEDILTPFEKTAYLYVTDQVERWYELNRETKHSRFPVIDQQLKVQGIVTAKDVMDYERDVLIEKVMTKHPITVSGKTSVASASHMMVWEGIEVLPVVDEYNRLQGIISRQDVLKALQMVQRQPQIGETIDDIVTTQFLTETVDGVFRCNITPQMTNHLGTLSYGVFTTIVTEAATRALRLHKRGDLVVENITIYFIKPVQIDSVIDIKPKLLEIGRKFGKVDVEVFNEGTLVGKALMMCQLIERQ
ncbi:inosine 5'-monophosphate dehydrogenase [Anoxybacillus sp. BCO1]|nr:inosine 5'-monophosphate dehydrogenase [Anoxybacillus sp. BCO1]